MEGVSFHDRRVNVLAFGQAQHGEHSRGLLSKLHGAELASLMNEVDAIAASDEENMVDWRKVIRGTRPGDGVVIDLGFSTYAGTARLSHMLHIHKEVKAQGGRVAIAASQAGARMVLKLCKIDVVIPVFESMDEAKLWLRQH